jgi:hypothetical protein
MPEMAEIPEIPFGWRETIFKRARQGKLRLDWPHQPFKRQLTKSPMPFT